MEVTNKWTSRRWMKEWVGLCYDGIFSRHITIYYDESGKYVSRIDITDCSWSVGYNEHTNIHLHDKTYNNVDFDSFYKSLVSRLVQREDKEFDAIVASNGKFYGFKVEDVRGDGKKCAVRYDLPTQETILVTDDVFYTYNEEYVKDRKNISDRYDLPTQELTKLRQLVPTPLCDIVYELLVKYRK